MRPGAVFSDPVLYIDDTTTPADAPAPEAAPAATGTTKSALVPLSGGSQLINLSGVRARLGSHGNMSLGWND